MDVIPLRNCQSQKVEKVNKGAKMENLNDILNGYFERKEYRASILAAVKNNIPIMLVNNTADRESCEKLRQVLRANGVVVVPETVQDFREYNTVYLRVDINSN